MRARIHALEEADARRASATPSTDPYHEAVREETGLAEDILDAARRMDDAP
jgi:hypothetical protein